MRRSFPRTLPVRVLPILLALVVPLGAEDAKEIFSGPQKGEKLKPFKVIGVYDESAGKELDFVTAAGEKPIFLIFVHQLTRPALGLTRTLSNWALEAGKKGEKLAVGVIWLDKDRTKAEEYLQRARQSIGLKTPLGISPDGEEGPGSYGLNRQVALTVLVGKAGKVEANFALLQPSDVDWPKIAAEVAKVLGIDPPSQEELRRHSGGEMRRAAGRGNDGDKEENDPRLRELLRAVIQKDASDDDVAKAIGRVEEHIRENAARRKSVGDICRRVVDSKPYKDGGYGGEKARAQLKKWAEELK